jgi:tetratricopeptide (TPR) repeat protein
MPPAIRVLFVTGSPPAYMAPPRLGREQINCGPHWPNAKDEAGRFVSLATPPGEYDLTAITAQLPPEQQPDLVVCLVDSSWNSLPRRLSAFKCPRILLVADTHHLRSPLMGFVRYLAYESFDRIVLLYDRHHAEILFAAGFRNLFWFPGLTFPHDDATVRAARLPGAARVPRIAFVGQAGKHHPRRERLITALTQGGVTLDHPRLGQREALPHYGQSTVGFNASLNGDLNLRVFEILAAGAALLTDRLAPESGLTQLLGDQQEMVTYDSPEDLVARATYALAHPSKLRRIAEAGARWFDRHIGERQRTAAFQALAFDGTPAPPFDFSPAEKTRVFFGGNTDRLLQTIIVYENLQELHRIKEVVQVDVDPAVAPEIARLFRTLPRVVVNPPGCGLKPDVSVHAGDSLHGAAGRWVWFPDVTRDRIAGLRGQLAGQGWSLASEDVALFIPSPLGPEACAAEALERGQNQRALELAQQELRSDPANPKALAVIARLAAACGNRALSAKMIRLLLDIDPANPLVQSVLEGLRQKALQQVNPARARPLAEAQLARGHFREAVAEFTALSRVQPDEPAHWTHLGRALVGARRLPEAAVAFRRAAELVPADAGLRLCAGEAALAAEQWEVARIAFAAAHALGAPQAAEGLERVRRGRAAMASPAEGYDLVICHVEITRLQGTGVLLQRFFPDAGPRLITLRAHSMYDGVMEIGGQHLVLDGFGLSISQREALLRRLLEPYRIRRILCVPYYPADFLHGFLARKITGAPLCSYVMDDQVLHGGEAVPVDVARWLFAASDLRLTISPEMREAYEKKFGPGFGVLPPIVTSVAARNPNHWAPGAPAPRCALVGNIWSRGQFEQLRALVKVARLGVDWYGNANVPWLPQDRGQLEADGIRCGGFLPEPELAKRLAAYPFVLVPSGQLDGSEDSESITRLSLPSRMVFIMVQTYTPMLVLGHPATAAAGFVRRLGVGLHSSYAPAEAAGAIGRLLDPAERAPMVENARRAAGAFVMPDAGPWIWKSLAAGEPKPCALTELMDREAAPGPEPAPAEALVAVG